MKLTKQQLVKIIKEEIHVIKEDWVRELQNAQYALEDKVEGVVIDTELEQPFYDFLKQLKAHIAEKSKARKTPPRPPQGQV